MTQPSSQGQCTCPEGAAACDCPRHAYMQDYVGQNPFKDRLRALQGSILGEILAGPINSPDVYIAPLLGVNFVEPWPVTNA